MVFDCDIDVTHHSKTLFLEKSSVSQFFVCGCVHVCALGWVGWGGGVMALLIKCSDWKLDSFRWLCTLGMQTHETPCRKSDSQG